MAKNQIKKLLVLALISLTFTACDSFMNGDDFFSGIEDEVKVANAEQVSIFVRYPNTSMGTTSISGQTVVKYDVPFTLTATTSDSYGFYKWAAFSTNDYPTSSQYKNLVFEDSSSYASSFGCKEISSEYVTFSNPRSASTTVTVKTNRKDIFIMPIVAKRPTMDSSNPSNNATDVVQNMSIRLLFSKAMDPASLDGRITVRKGPANVLSINDVFTDISDYFETPVTDNSGRLVSLKLKSGYRLREKTGDSNSKINVIISSDVSDIYGYTMVDDATITFNVGDKTDDAAPRITAFTGGRGTDYSSFANSGYQTASDENKVVTYSKYTSTLLANQRVSDSVNLQVTALDFTSMDSPSGDEGGVNKIYVRATSMVTGEVTNGVWSTVPGRAVTSSNTEKNYSSGSSYSTDLTKPTQGIAFNYPLTGLPDGIIKIDVWGIDAVGNEGVDETYDESKTNGFCSMYVVKDTKAPASSTDVSYGNSVASTAGTDAWFNATTLSNVSLKETASKVIQDYGYSSLVSNRTKLQWMFTVGSAPSAVSSADTRWKTIDSGNYALSGASAAADGNVNVYMFLKDDLDNISTPVAVTPLHYDNTSPSAAAISWEGSGSNAGLANSYQLDNQILNINFTEASSGIKKLELTVKKDNAAVSSTAFSGSNLEITYYPNEGSGTVLVKGTDYTVSGNTLTFTTPETTGKLSIKGLVINQNVTGSSLEGTYTVTAQFTDTAGNTDSTASVKSITIASDATKPVIQKIRIPHLKKGHVFHMDNESVVGPDDVYWLTRDCYGQDAATPENVPVYITINENGSGVEELLFAGTSKLTSGVQLYRVGTDGTTETLIPAADYTIVDSQTLRFASGKAPSNDSGKTSFTILVKGMAFTGAINSNSVTNSIQVTARDVAYNTSADYSSITTDNNNTLTEFYADSWRPGVDAVNISDQTADTKFQATAGFTNENVINMAVAILAEGNDASGQNSYTLTNAAFTSSTVPTIWLNNESKELSSSQFVLSNDNKTITFMEGSDYLVLRSAYTVTFTGIKLDSSADGSKTVSVVAADLSENNAPVKSASIILDTTPPKWTLTDSENRISGATVAPPYAVNYEDGTSANSDFIYPHSSSSTHAIGIDTAALGDSTAKVNGDGVPIRYFYTSAKTAADSKYGIVMSMCISEETQLKRTGTGTAYYYYKHSASDNMETIKNTDVVTKGTNPDTDVNGNAIPASNGKTWIQWHAFTLEDSETSAVYSVTEMDEAGNLAPASTFVIVKDAAGPSTTITSGSSDSLANLMTVDLPADGRVYRNTVGETLTNADYKFYGGVRNHSAGMYAYTYVIKDGEYKIRINLDGITSSKTALDGTTVSSASAYDERTISKTQSGLAQYAFSRWYGDWYVSPSQGSTRVALYPSGTLRSGTDSAGNKYVVSSANNSSLTAADVAAFQWINYTGGDLELTLPVSNENIAPYTLLLKDNCGNVSQILIAPPTADAQKYGVAWHVDSKLGSGATPLMYPGARVVTDDTSDFTFGTTKYIKDKYLSKSADRSSVRGYPDQCTGRFTRDYVHYTTIYNNNARVILSVDSENCLYEAAGAGDSDNFTVKARLLAVPYKTDGTITVPSYSDFYPSAADSRYSDWNYAKTNASSGEICIPLNYPHPDYSTLGTTFPVGDKYKKFRIYYIMEDTVGNYKIGALLNGYNDNEDWCNWYYDNTAPKLKIKNASGTYETVTPEQTAAITAANVSSLVPENRGYAPYNNNGTVFVSANLDNAHKNRSDFALNESLGYGTTRTPDMAGTDADTYKNLNYFDFAIEEDTGVRAFTYVAMKDFAPSIPAIDSDYLVVDGNARGTAIDSNSRQALWYEGYGATDINAYIGPCWYYGVNTSSGGDDSNAWFGSDSDFKDSTGIMWNGTKVCSLIPYDLLSSTESKNIYLIMMDWVGNTTRYQLGNFGWELDNTAPEVNSSLSSDDEIFTDTYYLNINKTSGVTDIGGMNLVLSGNAGSSTKIFLPGSDFTETANSSSTSGLAGWSKGTAPDTDHSSRYTTSGTPSGYYFIADKSDYSLTPAAENIYIYDKVGNYTVYQNKLSVSADTEAPDLTVSFSAPTNYALYSPDVTDQTAIKFTSDITIQKSTLTDIKAAAKKVYASAKKTFVVTLTTAATDVRNAYITPWNASSSVWNDSSKTDITNGLKADSFAITDKTYYQVSITDKCNNTSYFYFYAIVDSNVPDVDGTTEVEGAKKYNGKWYYKDASALKFKFKISDVSASGTESASGLKYWNIWDDNLRVNVSEDNLSSSSLITTKDIEVSPSETATGSVFGLVIKDNVLNTKTYLADESTCFAGPFILDKVSPEMNLSGVTFTCTNSSNTTGSWASYDSDNKVIEITSTSVRKVSANFASGATDKDSNGNTAGVCTYNMYDASDNLLKSGTSFDFTCNTSAASGVDVVLASGNEGIVRKFSAVDYAGNESEKITVTIHYGNSTIPTIYSVASVGTGSAYQIYANNGVNYFYSATPVLNISIKYNNSYYKPTAAAIYQNGTQVGDEVSVNGTSVTYTQNSSHSNRYDAAVTLASLPSGLTGSGTVTVVLKGSFGSSDPFELTYNSISKWASDTTAPAVADLNALTITASGLASGIVAAEPVVDTTNNLIKLHYYANASGPATTTASFTIAGTITDAGSGLYTYGRTTPLTDCNIIGVNGTYPDWELGVGYGSMLVFDGVGNYTKIASIGYHLDSTAPSTPTAASISFLNSSGTDAAGCYSGSETSYYVNTNTVKQIKFTGLFSTDPVISQYADGSGVDHYEYKVNSGDYTTITGTGFTVAAPSEVTTYTIVAVDLVGNKSETGLTYTITPDTTGPESVTLTPELYDNSTKMTTGWVLNNSTYYYNSTSINKLLPSLSGTDSLSGNSTVYYYSTSADGTKIKVSDSTEKFTLGSSEQTLYFWMSDNVGNLSSTSVSVHLVPDSTGPVATFSSKSGTWYTASDSSGKVYELYSSADASVTFELSDAGSGIADATVYSFVNSKTATPVSWSPVTLSNGKVTVNMSGADSLLTDTSKGYNVYLAFQDKLGNTSIVDVTATENVTYRRGYTANTSLSSYSSTITAGSRTTDDSGESYTPTYTVSFNGSLYDGIKTITVTLPTDSTEGVTISDIKAGSITVNGTSVAFTGSVSSNVITYTLTNPLLTGSTVSVTATQKIAINTWNSLSAPTATAKATVKFLADSSITNADRLTVFGTAVNAVAGGFVKYLPSTVESKKPSNATSVNVRSINLVNRLDLPQTETISEISNKSEKISKITSVTSEKTSNLEKSSSEIEKITGVTGFDTVKTRENLQEWVQQITESHSDSVMTGKGGELLPETGIESVQAAEKTVTVSKTSVSSDNVKTEIIDDSKPSAVIPAIIILAVLLGISSIILLLKKIEKK